MNDFDAVVVGAGAVGLACGFALAKRGVNVLVLERESRIGAGVSSRNSEVIHAGIHYPSGSLKARLCVEGRRALYDFLASHNVAHDRCGKLIVAVEQNEMAALESLQRQAGVNGVEGVRWLEGAEARTLEPQLRAVAAIESTASGVMDAHGYMAALEGEIAAHGGTVVLASPFLRAAPSGMGSKCVSAETRRRPSALANSSSPRAWERNPAHARSRASHLSASLNFIWAKASIFRCKACERRSSG